MVAPQQGAPRSIEPVHGSFARVFGRTLAGDDERIVFAFVNSELANGSLSIVPYLTLGAIGFSAVAILGLKWFDQTRIAELSTPAANGGLEFSDVIPRLQSLLSSSRPGLRLKNVLVPIDFSESSLRALPYASFLAGQFGCTVTLLYVVHLNTASKERTAPMARFLDEMRSGAERTLQEIASSRNLRARISVRFGAPDHAILQEATESDVDLIIVGRNQRKGIARLLAPSLDRRLIRRASCPTLIAP